jgi:hypothetical protein
MPVTTPFLLTLAISGFEDFHVILFLFPDMLSLIVSPIYISVDFSSNTMDLDAADTFKTGIKLKIQNDNTNNVINVFIELNFFNFISSHLYCILNYTTIIQILQLLTERR